MFGIFGKKKNTPPQATGARRDRPQSGSQRPPAPPGGHSADGEGLERALGDFELPTFPTVVLEALSLIRDPEASMRAVAARIALDPGLSVALLQQANSAAYALRREVRGVQHAATLLGRARLESALLAVGVRKVLPKHTAPALVAGRFWRTAAHRAVVARTLADRIHPATRDETFTASLLQDMALPLLAHAREREYAPLLDAWGGLVLATAEQSEFGWDHAQVGGWMCGSWSFPSRLTAGIGEHHADIESSALPAATLVGRLRDPDDQQGREALLEDARALYALSPDEVIGWLEASREAADELAALFR